MRRGLPVVGVVVALTLAACGGGGGGSSGGGGGSCSPSGTTIKVVAQNFAFDKTCYAATAGQACTIDLDNKDSALHNVAIYTDNSATKSLFITPTLSSQEKSFRSKPLPAGTYYFQCDVHTTMNGTFVVK